MNRIRSIPEQTEEHWEEKREEFEDLLENAHKPSPMDYRMIDVVCLWAYGCSIQEWLEQYDRWESMQQVISAMIIQEIKTSIETIKKREEEEKHDREVKRQEKEEMDRKKKKVEMEKHKEKFQQERRLRRKGGKEVYLKWKKSMIYRHKLYVDDDLSVTDVGSDWSDGW
jgi:hypothetical protein